MTRFTVLLVGAAMCAALGATGAALGVGAHVVHLVGVGLPPLNPSMRRRSPRCKRGSPSSTPK